jgi:raffinose/stachyose/melibiose transport system permease protein
MKLKKKNDNQAYLYILPAFLLSLVFIYYCIGFTFYSSFTDWDGMSKDMNFIGLKNYVKIFQDKTFYIAVKNNIIFFVGTVFIQATLGFVLAVLIKEGLKFANFFKTIYFLPIAMATSIITGIFRIILNPTTGSLNVMLKSAHLGFLAQSWLGNPQIALYSVIAINIFQWMGFSMMIYYSSLMAIPDDIYESANLEGASFFRVLWSITRPIVHSTTNLLIILGIVGSLKTFDIVKLLTNGGPGRATTVLNTYLYEKAFSNFAAGEAATIGIFILVLALIMSYLQVQVSKENE